MKFHWCPITYGAWQPSAAHFYRFKWNWLSSFSFNLLIFIDFCSDFSEQNISFSFFLDFIKISMCELKTWVHHTFELKKSTFIEQYFETIFQHTHVCRLNIENMSLLFTSTNTSSQITFVHVKNIAGTKSRESICICTSGVHNILVVHSDLLVLRLWRECDYTISTNRHQFISTELVFISIENTVHDDHD